MKKYFGEFLGTAILVLFGCGTASIAGSYVGALGIAISFGLALFTASCIISNISGCHVNPAVSLAMFISKKLTLKDFIGYIIAQILGAIVGIFILIFIITSANIGSIESAGLGATGFGKYSSIGLSMGGAILVEIILSFVFILGFLKISEDKNKKNISGLLISLLLILVHIIGFPLTGTSVNPARSLAPALFLGKEVLNQVWVFLISPLIGAIIAAYVNKYLTKEKK